jgi:hypothetical protein
MTSERITGTDGKTYPARWQTPQDREWLKGRVHYLHHNQQLSVRQIRAVLAEDHNVRRSVGWVSGVLNTWRCDHNTCSGDRNLSPEHQEPQHHTGTAPMRSGR